MKKSRKEILLKTRLSLLAQGEENWDVSDSELLAEIELEIRDLAKEEWEERDF